MVRVADGLDVGERVKDDTNVFGLCKTNEGLELPPVRWGASGGKDLKGEISRSFGLAKTEMLIRHIRVATSNR